MYITVYEVVGLLSAVLGVLMLGSQNVRFQLSLLSLSFIVICMHVGRVILGAPNPKFDYFRPLASSAIPVLLVVCSLLLGITSASTVWKGL